MSTELPNEGMASQEGVSQASQEKLIPQSQVNRIVQEAKLSSETKGYNKAMSEFQNQQPQNVSQQHNAFNPEDIRKAVAEELGKHTTQLNENAVKFQQQQQLEKSVKELTTKVAEAEKRIPDYAATLSQVGNFAETPGILHLANEVDNAGDVLYELAKNPHKIGSLLSVPPSIARSQIMALSNSIKTNQQADAGRVPDEPLRQINPTNLGVGKAPSTASDFAKQFRGQY